MLQYMATCPKGLEYVLARELRSLGVEQVQESIAACYFSASLALAYKVCWWTRVANRIVLLLVREQCHSLEETTATLQRVDWSDYFNSHKRIAVDFNGSNHFIKDSRYGAQIVKDSINDHFAALNENRLQVDRVSPEVLVYARLYKSRFSLGIDLVGDSLHRRGYRTATGEAPLKENLAAAILLMLNWQNDTEEYAALVDPMCGSATLLIEAALITYDIAPAHLRENWLVSQLLNFDESLWVRAQEYAQASAKHVSEQQIVFKGYDVNAEVIEIARANIDAAGLQQHIVVEHKSVEQLTVSDWPDHGLIVVNPPYGKRLGEAKSLGPLYQNLGKCLKNNFDGWDAAIFTGNPDLGWATGLRSWRQHSLYNGGIACQLQRYRVESKNYIAGRKPNSAIVSEDQLSDGAKMLVNRLRKNRRRLKPWRKQNPQTSCYRIYDADLPEYVAAIDFYRGKALKETDVEQSDSEDKTQILVQEYAAPAAVDADRALRRVADIEQAVSVVFELGRDDIVVKRRQRQRGLSQYQKQASSGGDLVVSEHGHRLIVNLDKYLDTGVFLDHRPVRRQIAQAAKGGKFLNLFAYTSTATVYAASAGARSSLSIDMSNTYLKWSKKNFALNNIPHWQHRLLRADCIVWLQTQAETNAVNPGEAKKYTCILLDPPSFSNSKRMQSAFDVQSDHGKLIDWSMACLEPDGVLFFSNNKRGFKLEATLMERYSVEDISKNTHDLDFDRQRLAHQCWKIRFRSENAE